MAVERIVVKAHFGVKRNNLSGFGYADRVDFNHYRVVVDKSLMHAVDERFQILGDFRLQMQKFHNLLNLLRAGAGNQIKMHAQNFVRRQNGQRRNVFVVGIGHQQRNGRNHPVNNQTGVKGLFDFAVGFDINAADQFAFGAGLHRYQR